jgi:hypothetical protein
LLQLKSLFLRLVSSAKPRIDHVCTSFFTLLSDRCTRFGDVLLHLRVYEAGTMGGRRQFLLLGLTIEFPFTFLPASRLPLLLGLFLESKLCSVSQEASHLSTRQL